MGNPALNQTPQLAEASVQPDRLSAQDRRFLDAALRLGQSRIGRTSPNPSVGAIIVRDTEHGPVVVGRGVTHDGGRPHGEVIALSQAGALARGATCYVSLEPCAHHGKTPPCTEALVNAGVARVVMAAEDPDPRVSGRGVSYLDEFGVMVADHAARETVIKANLGHFTRVERGRPAITLKLAVSRDGMIGRLDTGFVEITGDLARRSVHGLRARADAILVGIGTVLSDDPDLTCRLPGMEDWSPARIVLDRQAATPVDAKLFERIETVPVSLFVGENAPEERVIALEAKGTEVIRVRETADGLDLGAVTNHLAEAGCTNLMVEGGARVAHAFLDHNLVDRAVVYQSTKVLGEDALPALPGGADLVGVLSANGLVKGETDAIGQDSVTIWDRD